MIVSLVLTDRHSIGTDETGRFRINDKNINVKEVPFVRYRFDNFTTDDVEYITKMMDKFKYSTHMAEVVIQDGFDEQVNILNDNFENLAIFLYMPVYDSHVESCLLTEKDVELLEKVDGSMIYDRIMLKDCSNSLHLVSANRLKSEVAKVTGFKESDMGICNSPLSFGDDSCLTALRARTLASIYAQNDECALPSANHESMNCCGCIKYFKVESDLQAPVGRKATRTTTKKSTDMEDSGSDKKEENSKRKRGGRVIKAW